MNLFARYLQAVVANYIMQIAAQEVLLVAELDGRKDRVKKTLV